MAVIAVMVIPSSNCQKSGHATATIIKGVLTREPYDRAESRKKTSLVCSILDAHSRGICSSDAKTWPLQPVLGPVGWIQLRAVDAALVTGLGRILIRALSHIEPAVGRGQHSAS